jgi:hypothetical protein
MMALSHFLAGGGEIGSLMRAKPWGDSPLGPPETWLGALKMAVGICLNSPFPISLWWGPELVMLYNAALLPILGKTKHPAGLGRRPGIESWLVTSDSRWKSDSSFDSPWRCLAQSVSYTDWS